jgi:hypothetical protein
MALPKQIEQQLKEIEALEQKLAAPSETNETPVDTQTEAPPQEPETVQTAEVQPTEPKPVPVVSEENWEQKYNTLNGKYNAEVPRLHAQVKDLVSQLEQLKTQVNTKPEVKEAPVQVERLVTDEDVEAFGSDLIEVQRKVAKEVAMEFRKDLDLLKAENEKLKEQLLKTGNQVGEFTFEQKLHRLVPDFVQVNEDPRWISWLDEVDPLLRAPRRTVAQEAFSRGDAEAVADYVGMFKSSLPKDSTSARQAEVQRQVQPTRSVATQQPVSQKGKTYTTREIETMFAKATKLHASQKFEEAKKLEAEIDAAYMEGRVTA